MVNSIDKVSRAADQSAQLGKRAWTAPSIADEDARNTAQAKTGGHEATSTTGVPS